MNRSTMALIMASAAAGSAWANTSAFDLIYEPTDGSVWFDTNGGQIIGYIVQGGPFFGHNHISAIIPPEIPKPYDKTSAQLGSNYLGAPFLNDPVSLGQVLPAGLSEQDFLARITKGFYLETLGQGYSTDFELFYGFPEQRQPRFDGGGVNAGTTEVSIGVQGLFDHAGQPLKSATRTMAVIDVDGDGLAGFDFAHWTGDSFLPDPDDVLISDPTKGVWSEQTGDLKGLEVFVPDSVEFSVLNSGELNRYKMDIVNSELNDASTVGAGDQVYLFYFPDLPLDAESPGVSQSFGVVKIGVLSNPGELTHSMMIGVDTVYLADNTTGSGTIANLVTVPEPGTFAALSLPGMLLLRRRRRG